MRIHFRRLSSITPLAFGLCGLPLIAKEALADVIGGRARADVHEQGQSGIHTVDDTGLG